MEDIGNAQNLPLPAGDSRQATIRLLQMVQADYQGARGELERVSQLLSDRESLINQQLQKIMLAPEGYRILSLLPYGVGVMPSRIGKVILGETVRITASTEPRRLLVRFLGRFEISFGSRSIEQWRSKKAKSVMQLLLSRRQPVIKDIIMEALWPDCTPQTAGNNLKVAVHGLRSSLARLFPGAERFPVITFDQGSYSINPDIEVRIDADEFEEHWANGRRLERSGRTDEALRQFGLAEALYRGDYLEDDLYDQWTLLRREGLRDTYLMLLGKLASYALQRQDYESGVVYCQKMLAKDNCREDAYRKLMMCYAALGDRNRALKWFKVCRSILLNELSSEPEPETLELYNRILKTR